MAIRSLWTRRALTGQRAIGLPLLRERIDTGREASKVVSSTIPPGTGDGSWDSREPGGD